MNHGYLPVIAGQPLNLMMQGVARAGRMLGGGAAGRQPAIGKTQLLHRCGQRLPAIVDQQSGAQITPAARLRGDSSSEKRRVGKECVSPFSSWWSSDH